MTGDCAPVRRGAPKTQINELLITHVGAALSPSHPAGISARAPGDLDPGPEGDKGPCLSLSEGENRGSRCENAADSQIRI